MPQESTGVSRPPSTLAPEPSKIHAKNKKCMKKPENPHKSMRIYENQLKSMKFMKIHGNLWDIFVLNRIKKVILYILRKYRLHTSVL